MADNLLPNDFKEFLKFLNEAGVEYLLIGGYAVGYYGYPRTTADIDVWVAISPENASKIIRVLHRFGMNDESLHAELFLNPGNIIRLGVPPMRIEILTSIDGVEFPECFKEKKMVEIDGIKINLISLHHLKENKRASARHKDLSDLDHLP